MKSMDEKLQTVAANSAALEGAAGASRHQHDRVRRRFVRGLAAAGPMIITLRSASAAAVSCGPGYEYIADSGQVPDLQGTDMVLQDPVTCLTNEYKLATTQRYVPQQAQIVCKEVVDETTGAVTYTCDAPFALLSGDAATSIINGP